MAMVWVYGTLRQGEDNHHLLADCAFIGKWWSPTIFTLLDLGEYPGVIDGRQAVLGEIYVVDEATLARLDALEEVPDEYRHGRLYTRWGEALYYHYQGPVLSGHPIVSGDWCARFVC